MKTYGPYTRDDGRKHIIIIHDDGRRQTKSWPRVILEKKLGRELLDSETVDHVDNDFTNDDPNNLQPLSLIDNAKKEMLRPERVRKTYEFICPMCKTKAVKFLNQVKRNTAVGKAGPFCSRSCAGKYSHAI